MRAQSITTGLGYVLVSILFVVNLCWLSHVHFRTTPSPSLDFDVFRAILNHLSIADLKQIAVVSHLFHEEALREIFLRGVRFTRTVTKLHAFCIFMCDRRRRDPPLFSFLRTLHINITSFTMGEYFHPDPLFTVLSRASSLNDLEIYWTNRMFSPTYNERLAAIIPEAAPTPPTSTLHPRTLHTCAQVRCANSPHATLAIRHPRNWLLAHAFLRVRGLPAQPRSISDEPPRPWHLVPRPRQHSLDTPSHSPHSQAPLAHRVPNESSPHRTGLPFPPRVRYIL